MAGNGVDAARGFAAAREDGAAFPKRFYSEAAAAPAEDGWALRLDGRAARTPGRKPLVLPTRALAEAVATEWAAVADTIDPRRMPLTRLVNTVIDGVSARPDAVLAEVDRFVGSDLVVYRAGEPAELVRAQADAWDDLVAWSRDTFDAPLTLGEGVMFVAQPAASLARLGQALRDIVGHGPAAPYRIAALHVMTSLTGSALLAMAAATGRLTAEQAWAAAHVDEDHQMSLWGEDWEAAQRRVARWSDMHAADRLFRLASDGGVASSG